MSETNAAAATNGTEVPNVAVKEAHEAGILSDETTEGVRTIVVTHWRKFSELMARTEMLRPGLIWRGQKRGDLPRWALKPRLDRSFVRSDPAPGEDEWGEGRRRADETKQWDLRYVDQLERFKVAAAGRRGFNPPNLDGNPGEERANDEWWALGQHYGLHTPLLDWTGSPFAALFFAFLEDSTQERKDEPLGENYRCVFALDRPAIELWNADQLAQRKRWLMNSPLRVPAHIPGNPDSLAQVAAQQERERRERLYFSKIRVVRPTTDENLRLLNQGGMFTQAPPGKDLEGHVRETFGDERRRAVIDEAPLPPYWMMKIKILEDDQRDCLIYLNRMGINQRSLFPDLLGACNFVNRAVDDPLYRD